MGATVTELVSKCDYMSTVSVPFFTSKCMISFSLPFGGTFSSSKGQWCWYGCSECNWIYRALTPEEASQMSWYAQIDFEKHDCSANQLTPPHKKPA